MQNLVLVVNRAKPYHELTYLMKGSRSTLPFNFSISHGVLFVSQQVVFDIWPERGLSLFLTF
ncbi:hypothetical protein C1O24_07555 [Vibrio diazotrophicus]|nr:hypothetical protein C1O24_07555 [Vibrio diazotrophicus]